MGRRNSIIGKGLCVILPVFTLTAAHYFPWKKTIRRDLHPIETYAIGTGAILGTATVAMTMSDSECEDHIVMMWMAGISAGLITITAHAIDYFVKQNARIADLEAQTEAMKGNEHNV